MNELIRELVEALEYEHSFLTGRESHYGSPWSCLSVPAPTLKQEAG